MNALVAAIQFLTVCPVPSRFRCGEKELERSVAYFPVVGLLLGILLAFFDRGLAWLLPPLPASVIVVIAMLTVSGCLHMDGLADTADGFLSSRPREQILEIMKDSRTGPMGVIAVVCIVVLKVSLLVSVPGRLRWGTVLLMPLAGRCALVFQMAMLPYARHEKGLAAVFGKPRWPAATPAILAAVAWMALKTVGLASAGISLAAVAVYSGLCRRKIGGFTGDTLGAACEIVEVIPALVAASWRLSA